jgi:anti-sigma regulatory factor (Ser/Thr protein kinase)
VTAAPALRLHLAGTAAAGIARAQDAARDWLAARGVPGTVAARAELLIEEVALNILRHGFASGSALDLTISVEDGHCVLAFEDRGIAFDPTTAALPPRASGIEAAPPGGRGLRLIRALAAEARYARSQDGRNLLRLVVAEGRPLTP